MHKWVLMNLMLGVTSGGQASHVGRVEKLSVTFNTTETRNKLWPDGPLVLLVMQTLPWTH